jgi:ABC-2 type transport system permease protein
MQVSLVPAKASRTADMRQRGPAQGWRTASITALSDMLSPGRIPAVAMRLAIQLLLVVYLWRALYAHAGVTAGLTKTMAVSYAALAVLAMHIRRADRFAARDMVIQHLQYGTIVYWFLRPLSPQRYCFWRGVGEQAYGLAWACAGGLVCMALGALSPPKSAGAAAAFAVTFAAGQSLLYYLALLTDLMCFWTIKNVAVVSILAFAQNLLSGAYAALWYFPDWFQLASKFLPFQYTIGVPVSFYVGRMPLAEVPSQLGIAASWIALLAILTRLLWRKASARMAAQGG